MKTAVAGFCCVRRREASVARAALRSRYHPVQAGTCWVLRLWFTLSTHHLLFVSGQDKTNLSPLSPRASSSGCPWLISPPIPCGARLSPAGTVSTRGGQRGDVGGEITDADDCVLRSACDDAKSVGLVDRAIRSVSHRKCSVWHLAFLPLLDVHYSGVWFAGFQKSNMLFCVGSKNTPFCCVLFCIIT